MFKNQLQELCQKRQWPLPVYTSTRDGPDHNPRFGASVTVNGLTFNSTELSRSYKEAHNKAAQIAIDALTPALPPPQPPSDTQISQKSQLQNLLTKKNLVPVYSCVRVGPPHAPRFKATVEFDGQIFESQQFYKTLKEAEQDAAKLALLALPPEESLQPKDESGFYKNLLQELAQKEGLSLPVYKTIRNDESHIPTFSSTVEIGGESFDGDAAKTKKLAEMSAAKVAYCQLQEQMAGFKIVASETLFNDQEADSAGETADHGSSHTVHPPKMVSTVLADVEDSVDSTSSEDPVEDSVDSTSSEDGSAESSLGSSHLHTVKVYPRKPDMVLPKGAVLLPFSDDKWAAVDLDFSNDGGDL